MSETRALREVEGVSALGGAHQRAAEHTKAQLSAAVRSMNADWVTA